MDRRLKTRVEWNGPVKYRLLQSDPYRTGLLVNISTNGAMLWLNEDIAIDSSIEVLMQSEYDPEPVQMHMRVVRKQSSQREGYTGYGCELEMTVSELE